MTPQRRKNTYKLSPVQEGLLLDELDAKDSGIDIGQIVCSMEEPLDVELLKSVWRKIVDRHEALRTSFHLRKGEEPHQNVHREVTLPWNAQDLRALSGARQESELNRWLREDLKARFELDRDPLFRLNLFRLGDEKWTLVWTFHRGILDSRSVPIVLTEVFRTYDAARRSEALDLPNVRPYADYLQFLHSLEISESDKYWRKMLRGFASPTALGQLECERGEEGYAEEEVQLSTTVTQALEELAIRERFTVNNAVQAAWAAALSRYNGTADVVFGVTRPCRGFLPRAGSMVGTYSNTLPVRVKIPGTLSVFDLLRQIRANEIAGREYEHTPLPRIQAWSELPLGSPLFASVVVFDHAALNSQMKSPYLDWTKRQVRLHEQTNCPVTLYAYAEPALTLRLAYDRRRFGQGQMQQILGHLETLLKDIATGIDKSAGELQSLIKHEQNRTYPKAGFCAPPQIEQVVVPVPAPIPASVPALEDMSPAKATPPPVKPSIDSALADHALWSLLGEKLSPADEQNPARIEEQERTYPRAGLCAPRQIEQVVTPVPAPVPAMVPALEDMSPAKATLPPVKPTVDSALADHALWSLLAEKLSPADELPAPAPVPATEDMTPAKAATQSVKPGIDNPPADRDLWSFLGEKPPVEVPSVCVPVDAVPLQPVLKVEHSRPVEHNRPAEPFAWATEPPKKAKRAARTKPVRSRPALDTVLHEVLESVKGAALATASVKNHLPSPSALSGFLKGRKGGKRPDLGAKKSAAPQFVLRELLKSDYLPQQPADKLKASRPVRDSGIQDGHPGVVTIQPNGTKPPIFCISALDGDLTVFRTLSAGLGNDQPVYALEPSSIKNDPAILTDVKKIARFYIDRLHAAGEDRPYCLVGYSFGGLVALEMSQQLRASGAEVPATVLIDTHYPAGCRAYEKLYDRMHRYKEHLLKRDSVHSSMHDPAGSSQVTPEISKIEQRAADRYRTRPYPGRACVLKASTPLDLFDGGPRIGWDKIFNDNLSIYYDIPGDRGIINTSKQAGLMVRRLREFLGGVEESRVVPALSRIAS
jgi:thioesterase domain-containing protein